MELELRFNGESILRLPNYDVIGSIVTYDAEVIDPKADSCLAGLPGVFFVSEERVADTLSYANHLSKRLGVNVTDLSDINDRHKEQMKLNRCMVVRAPIDHGWGVEFSSFLDSLTADAYRTIPVYNISPTITKKGKE